jgi:hypothetical protein
MDGKLAHKHATIPHGDQESLVWWGEFACAEGKALRWRIGPLIIHVHRLTQEWRIGYERSDVADDGPVGVECAVPADPVSESDEHHRFVFRRTTETLRLLPGLADRSVVARPVAPFYVPPGEEAVLFVSSPLWVQIAANYSRQQLESVPIVRPSDTWFGPSTREGELCYASTTHCRVNLDELPIRAHRAVTPVQIVNRATGSLLIDRINLPVIYLSLYSAPSGQLWTDTVTITREALDDNASLRLHKRAPPQAGDAVLLCEPRLHADKGILSRAFSALFS